MKQGMCHNVTGGGKVAKETVKHAFEIYLVVLRDKQDMQKSDKECL